MWRVQRRQLRRALGLRRPQLQQSLPSTHGAISPMALAAATQRSGGVRNTGRSSGNASRRTQQTQRLRRKAL